MSVTSTLHLVYCRLYSTSVTCVEDLIRGCNEDEGVYARHIIGALDQGLGQLCHEDATYKRTLSFIKH